MCQTVIQPDAKCCEAEKALREIRFQTSSKNATQRQ